MEGAPLTDLVGYDGTCGLCHRTVRFLVARDDGSRFQFTPLQGETLRARLDPAQFAALPDSLVVLTDQGLLLKARAVAHLLRRLGGGWAALGRFLDALPDRLTEAGYNFVARVRHQGFKRPEGACPRLPEGVQGRFLP